MIFVITLIAFKNLIVNGLVLASDGKKMSKRLSNYPDPLIVLKKYGAGNISYYPLLFYCFSHEFILYFLFTCLALTIEPTQSFLFV